MRVTARLFCNAADDSDCACACVMAERRRSALAGEDQNNGGTLKARKPRDPLSSYLYRSVVTNGSCHFSSLVYSGRARRARVGEERTGRRVPGITIGRQGKGASLVRVSLGGRP